MLRRVRLLRREFEDRKLGLMLFVCILEMGASNLEPNVGYTDMLLVVLLNPSKRKRKPEYHKLSHYRFVCYNFKISIH